jgi:hypothetical protein
MSLDFATRKHYYNLCKPNESLSPTDNRNLDIDAYGTESVRGINWVERLASGIELSDTPAFELFTGLPGSGKSTELRRLMARLERRDGAHLLPVLVDAEEVLDLTSPIDVPDIIAAIMLETEKKILATEGKGPDNALYEGYMIRLWNWLTQTNVQLKEAEFSIPGVSTLVAEMKTRPTLRTRVRETIAGNLSQFLQDARDELKLYHQRARQCGFSGLVIIFDSLEKLRGMSTNWEEVLSSAERIFAGDAPHLQLPVHVLYTIPPALVARRFDEVRFLPMLKLRTREGAPSLGGIETARALIRKRIPDTVLAAILGPDVEERVQRLIQWSGGYPRELIRLLQSVLAIPTHPISESAFARVGNELRDAYRKIVPADAFPWLAQVATTRYVTHLNREHAPVVDLMLSNSAVMRYMNQHDWFDLHPAVAEIPGVQEAIAALAQPRTRD